MLQGKAIQPFRAGLLGEFLFSHNQAVGSMSAFGSRLFLAGLQFFASVLADRFEHHEARFSIRLFDLLQQAFIHHGCHAVEQVQIEIAFGVTDRFDCLEGASAHEHR